jgi:hypothetical protein
MGSKLTGLFRTLTWADFKGPQPSSNPDKMLAETKTVTSKPFFTFTSEGKGATKTWQLNDSIVIDITIDSNKSWKLPSVDSMAQAEKDRLLKHEQGHYNLVALLARDMFIELMQVKAVRTAAPQDALKLCTDIQTRYANITQQLQDLYDNKAETDHFRNIPKQTKWDGFINTSFTKARASQMTAPDGTLYKEEILTVLRSNGITI